MPSGANSALDETLFILCIISQKTQSYPHFIFHYNPFSNDVLIDYGGAGRWAYPKSLTQEDLANKPSPEDWSLV
jgi:hypothetical protein